MDALWRPGGLGTALGLAQPGGRRWHPVRMALFPLRHGLPLPHGRAPREDADRVRQPLDQLPRAHRGPHPRAPAGILAPPAPRAAAVRLLGAQPGVDLADAGGPTRPPAARLLPVDGQLPPARARGAGAPAPGRPLGPVGAGRFRAAQQGAEGRRHHRTARPGRPRRLRPSRRSTPPPVSPSWAVAPLSRVGGVRVGEGTGVRVSPARGLTARRAALREGAAQIEVLAGQDLVVGLELAAEADGGDAGAHLDEREPVRVDPRRGRDEDLRLAGAVVHEDLVTEGQVADDLRDRAGDLHQGSFGGLADVTGRDRVGFYMLQPRTLLDAGQRGRTQDELAEAVVCQHAGHPHLLEQVEDRIVGRAHIDPGRRVLDPETLVEGGRREGPRRGRHRAFDGDHGAQRLIAGIGDRDHDRVGAGRDGEGQYYQYGAKLLHNSLSFRSYANTAYPKSSIGFSATGRARLFLERHSREDKNYGWYVTTSCGRLAAVELSPE